MKVLSFLTRSTLQRRIAQALRGPPFVVETPASANDCLQFAQLVRYAIRKLGDRIRTTVEGSVIPLRGLSFIADSLGNGYRRRFQAAAMLDRISDAILHLPDRERLIFTLYYYEELTTGEIQFLLEETESTVSEIHDSALLSLRRELTNLE